MSIYESKQVEFLSKTFGLNREWVIDLIDKPIQGLTSFESIVAVGVLSRCGFYDPTECINQFMKHITADLPDNEIHSLHGILGGIRITTGNDEKLLNEYFNNDKELLSTYRVLAVSF